MNWDAFVEGLRNFWNQPVPIIGFTVGTVICGIIYILGKTSIGKKALNKIIDINNGLREQLTKAENDLVDANNKIKELIKESQNKIDELVAASDVAIKNKQQEIEELANQYELKMLNYKEKLLKQEEMIKVICENSVNKVIKEAYEKYSPVLELPVPEIQKQIEEKVKSEYEDRLKKLEELVYGEREETTND